MADGVKCHNYFRFKIFKLTLMVYVFVTGYLICKLTMRMASYDVRNSFVLLCPWPRPRSCLALTQAGPWSTLLRKPLRLIPRCRAGPLWRFVCSPAW